MELCLAAGFDVNPATRHILPVSVGTGRCPCLQSVFQLINTAAFRLFIFIMIVLAFPQKNAFYGVPVLRNTNGHSNVRTEASGIRFCLAIAAFDKIPIVIDRQVMNASALVIHPTIDEILRVQIGADAETVPDTRQTVRIATAALCLDCFFTHVVTLA